MLSFHLFRIKLLLFGNSLFNVDVNRQAILQTAIEEMPSSELRRGYIWHVGNLIPIGNDGFYFALGRTTSTIVELYDENNKEFLDVEFERAPYTHVFFNKTHQIIAIAKKSLLSPTVPGIARQLEKLLNESQNIRNLDRRVEISEINDPEDFITHIRNAYAVTNFTVEFGLPNVFDAQTHFQRPMQDLLDEANAEKGKTSLVGADMNRETLESLARATAATGKDASAKVKTSQEDRGTTKHLAGNPAVITEEEIQSIEQKIATLERLVARYEQIRRFEG